MHLTTTGMNIYYYITVSEVLKILSQQYAKLNIFVALFFSSKDKSKNIIFFFHTTKQLLNVKALSANILHIRTHAGKVLGKKKNNRKYF